MAQPFYLSGMIHPYPFTPPIRSNTLLTESEVSRSWTRLFTAGDPTEETFESAESLLDGLRPESPLRLRLSQELEELKKIHDAQVSA